MSTRTFGSADLARVVHGDMGSFLALLEQPHDTLRAARNALPDLVLTARAVGDVLRAFQQRQIEPHLVQRWASFMTRGFTEGGRGPIRPIDIEYESTAEDWIVEVLFRLDEIGDLIDGEISDAELRDMIACAPIAAGQAPPPIT